MRAQFEISDLFAPDDPVSQFITGLCMVTNDLMLATEKTDQEYQRGDQAREGVSLFYMYLMCSHYREAAKFLHSALDSNEVSAFIRSLPDDARQNLEILRNSFSPWEGSFVQTHLKLARDDTFHYPAFGSSRLQSAMTEASEIDSCIDLGDGTYQNTRYRFADEVFTKLVYRHFGKDENEIRKSFEQVANLIVALTHLTHSAVTQFLKNKSQELFRVES